MRPVSDAFLLSIAEISSALVGLFLVGIFFYAETGFGRSENARRVAPYFRASTRLVLVLYAIPIGLSLSLVVLEPVWSTVLFAVMSAVLVAANVASAVRVRGVSKPMASKMLLILEVAGTVGVGALVVVPWVLGGLNPSREDLTWSILISFGLGFVSVCALVLSAFDIARAARPDRPDDVAVQEELVPPEKGSRNS